MQMRPVFSASLYSFVMGLIGAEMPGVVGIVRAEDKQGNDHADEGAEKGSGQAQQVMAVLAGLFNYRNSKYRNVVERIQTFIVKMKKARKE